MSSPARPAPTTMTWPLPVGAARLRWMSSGATPKLMKPWLFKKRQAMRAWMRQPARAPDTAASSVRYLQAAPTSSATKQVWDAHGERFRLHT